MFVVTTAVMREADKKTISLGTHGIELMKRTAEAIFRELRYDDKVAIVCGKGNNGGDGYALATVIDMLAKNEIGYDIYAIEDPITVAAKHYRDRVSADKILSSADLAGKINEYNVVVDCMFGTGFHGAIPTDYRRAIELINGASAKVIACDIPSGLGGDNGVVSDIAVNADITLAIGARKCGYYLGSGKDYCGEIILADIGIDSYSDTIEVVDEVMVNDAFTRRKHNAHKGDFGNLVIVADSNKYVGAGVLAATAAINTASEVAMRSGVGYCRLCVPKQLVAPLQSSIVHASLLSREELSGAKPTAVVFGVGVDDKDAVDQNILRDLISGKVPLLIDASGLTMLSHDPYMLDNKRCDIVITPHVKEMSRLSGYSVAKVLANPVAVAREFAKRYNVTVLLKGSSTIITDGVYTDIMIDGTPALAKGGSGDVLAGIIGALLARGVPSRKAASVGSLIHAHAGIIACAKTNEYSVTPLDVASAISEYINAK